MKSTNLLFLLLLFSFFSCSKSPVKYKEEAEDMMRPSEMFDLQRGFPDDKVDVLAYQKSLKAAMQQSQFTTRTPGFDKEWLTEGPGNIGARVNVLALHPTNANIIYAGFSQGGMYKTTDGGATWNSLSTLQYQMAIGDIEIDPSNPQTVWVGTGDRNMPGIAYIGDGVYKSTDGGQTWTNKGLTNTGVISGIRIHPTNSNIIYASAMGIPFEKTVHKGVYKTTDGGNTWTKVLYVNDSTGIIDIEMDGQNPQVLYAASWSRVRSNTKGIISSDQAFIYKTTDGGATWNILTNGLPQGVFSRIGLAMSSSNNNILYASYVAQNLTLGGIYKTTNGGNSWTEIPTDSSSQLENPISDFGWYFPCVEVHPTIPERIYILGVDLWVYDGLGIWGRLGPPWFFYDVHADKHDLKFKNGQMYLATDGGIYQSGDEGQTWTDIENIAATQFYRVAFNPHQPLMSYGGAQDNGTTGGNASNINNWDRIYGGDGFTTIFHPTNPQIFYVSTQNGNVSITEDGGAVFSYLTPNTTGENVNWDMPYIMSAADPDVLYLGRQRVFKSTDRGFTWGIISDTLTGKKTAIRGARNITSLAESPVNEAIIFAGTGDGRVWRTQNGGNTWDSLHQNGLPHRYVTSVRTSPTSDNVAYVTYSGYKDNDNTPHIFKTTDYGDTWVSIASNLPNFAINDLLILPGLNDQVLCISTDAGIYATTNAGGTWERLGTNMPYVPTFGIAYNATLKRLIAGTFARSIMSYDLNELINSVSIKQGLPVFQLMAYPNIATDAITLTWDKKLPKETVLSVFNTQGVRYFQQPIGETAQSYTLDLRNYPPGNYFLQLQNGSGKKTIQCVKVEK